MNGVVWRCDNLIISQVFNSMHLLKYANCSTTRRRNSSTHATQNTCPHDKANGSWRCWKQIPQSLSIFVSLIHSVHLCSFDSNSQGDFFCRDTMKSFGVEDGRKIAQCTQRRSLLWFHHKCTGASQRLRSLTYAYSSENVRRFSCVEARLMQSMTLYISCTVSGLVTTLRPSCTVLAQASCSTACNWTSSTSTSIRRFTANMPLRKASKALITLGIGASCV